MLGVFPGLKSLICESVAQAQLSGRSNGQSSDDLELDAFGLTCLFFSSASRRCRIFASKVSPAPFLSVWDTNFPRTASSRIRSFSFLIPYSDTPPPFPRPALDFFSVASVQISRWSVISWFTSVTGGPHLAHPTRWTSTDHAAFECRLARSGSPPTDRQGPSFSSQPQTGSCRRD